MQPARKAAIPIPAGMQIWQTHCEHDVNLTAISCLAKQFALPFCYQLLAVLNAYHRMLLGRLVLATVTISIELQAADLKPFWVGNQFEFNWRGLKP